jgi:hypothetical protein
MPQTWRHGESVAAKIRCGKYSANKTPARKAAVTQLAITTVLGSSRYGIFDDSISGAKLPTGRRKQVD